MFSQSLSIIFNHFQSISITLTQSAMQESIDNGEVGVGQHLTHAQLKHWRRPKPWRLQNVESARWCKTWSPKTKQHQETPLLERSKASGCDIGIFIVLLWVDMQQIWPHLLMFGFLGWGMSRFVFFWLPHPLMFWFFLGGGCSGSRCWLPLLGLKFWTMLSLRPWRS